MTSTTRQIDLHKPFEHHGATIATLTLKEPSGGLYADLGEPRILVRTGQGGGYYVEQPQTIKAYLDKLIDHQDGAELLKLMGLADVMQTKEQLFGFFADAEAVIISKRLTSSSSA